MGLFNRKKKEERSALPLPEFPKLPAETNFPFYDEQLNEKKENSMPKPSFNMTESYDFEREKDSESQFDEFTPRRSPILIERKDDKPIFVKIDKYKEAVKTIESIRTKIEEAESLMKNLTRLREQEEKELQEWQSNLDDVKQKLMKVDKNLFEV